MVNSQFARFGLSQPVLQAVAAMGFEEPSPIQAQAIPALMERRDVAGLSQTGSGKTAAFAIPAVERCLAGGRGLKVLVLCPTRELAVQISGEFEKVAASARGVSVLPIYGGQSYSVQYRGLKDGANVVVGTPGRILDHLERGSLKLEGVEMVVLDEADRMLDMGFREDIAAILAATPEGRQTALFSATMNREVERLVDSLTRDALKIRIGAESLPAPDIEERVYDIGRTDRVEAVRRVLACEGIEYGIIFCSTKLTVDRVMEELNDAGLVCDRLHGDMTQAMRERVLARFRERRISYLVATDVAARGIDVADVEGVINFDLPRDLDDYVHRIGRTGRAGRSGKALSLATRRDAFHVRRIEHSVRRRFPIIPLPGREEIEELRLKALLDRVRVVLEGGEFKLRDHLLTDFIGGEWGPRAVVSAMLEVMAYPKGRPKVEEPRAEDRGSYGPPRRRDGRSGYGGEGGGRGGRRDDREGRDRGPGRPPMRRKNGREGRELPKG